MPDVSDKQIERLKKSVPKKLGSAIKNARKGRKLSQTELAMLTQKDRQYIYKIETGKVTPNIVTISIIAKALDVEVAELLRDL